MTGITTRLADHATKNGARAAIVFDDRIVAWRDLHDQIEGVARWIDAHLPPGGALALHLPNCPALALLFLAAAHAGREAQILDAEWPRATVRAVLNGLMPARIMTFDPDWRGEGILHIDPRADFAAIARAFPSPPKAAPLAAPAEAAPFYVGLTSGSTGVPKAYRRHHGSWIASFAADAIEFGLNASDTVLAPGNLSHSLFLYALAHGLHAGATVILCRRFRPPQVLALAQRHRATVLYGVPTQLALLCEAQESLGLAPHVDMRWVLATGAKWFARATPALRRLFPNARFAEFYGASETSFITVAKDGEDAPPDSVGRAFHGVTLSIRDTAGTTLGVGEAGQVYVDSPMLFSGYALGGEHQPARIGAAMSVGDIGYLDARGFLHLVGRARRMIVTSGKNLFPEEVEGVLERHPAIAHAAVFAVADDKRGERLVAVIALRGPAQIARAELVAYLRAALPAYKVPGFIAATSDWPMTRSGKTDYDAVRARWQAGGCQPIG